MGFRWLVVFESHSLLCSGALALLVYHGRPMSRLLQGTDGFEYAFISVRRDIPIEDVAKVTQAGTLRLVVDHYNLWTVQEENDEIYLEQLEGEVGLDHDEDRGFYEADNHDETLKELMEKLVETEVKQTVPAMVAHYRGDLQSVTVVANVQYRLDKDCGDWDDMLAFLNSRLPAELQLTMKELATFDSDCLAEFDPELHEAHRDDGTLFLQTFLDDKNDENGIGYLAFRMLVHAIQHDIEILDVDDEPHCRRVLFSLDNDDEDEEGEDEEDEEEARDQSAREG